MSILRRELAPISSAGWAEIDEEAKSVLQTNLATRRFVDLVGPRGWDCSAVNLATLDDIREDGGVNWALREVLPLIEFRVPFVVNRWELDNLERGAEEIDLDAVRKAALAAARFEERIVYEGCEPANIVGLRAASEHDPIGVGSDAESISKAVTAATMKLADAGVDGPFMLVLGESIFSRVTAQIHGYPLRQQLTKLIGKEPIYSPSLEGGLLLSLRGGDFPLTIGVDMAIGYDKSDGDDIHLYLTESLTFRVTGAEAVVVLEDGKGKG